MRGYRTSVSPPVAAHAASKKSAAADVQVLVQRLVAAGSKRFGQVSWSGSWLAGPTGSIKYEFMFLTPINRA